jgi:hypothetical protein
MVQYNVQILAPQIPSETPNCYSASWCSPAPAFCIPKGHTPSALKAKDRTCKLYDTWAPCLRYMGLVVIRLALPHICLTHDLPICLGYWFCIFDNSSGHPSSIGNPTEMHKALKRMCSATPVPYQAHQLASTTFPCVVAFSIAYHNGLTGYQFKSLYHYSPLTQN